MPKFSNVEADPGVLLVEQGSNPATPASGLWRMFTKSDGLYVKDDAGAVTGPMGAGGGSGIVPVRNAIVATMSPFEINATNFDPGSNNRAVFTPWLCLADVTVGTAYFRVASQSGTMDIAIMDDTLTRLGSTGSFSVPSVGQASQALTGSVALDAGSLYYFGVSMSTTAADLYGYMAVGSAIALGATGFYAYKDSSHPIGTGPITPTGLDGIARQAFVAFE